MKRINIRLQRILRISKTLKITAQTEAEIYNHLRESGFSEDLEEEFDLFLEPSALQKYNQAKQRVLNENQAEYQFVISTGQWVKLLLFCQSNGSYYHIKIDNQLTFQFVYQTRSGSWKTDQQLNEEECILFAQLQPILSQNK